MPRNKKDYSYRGIWKHKYSRARNLAQRGGLTKKAMMKKYGRFPMRGEWWGPEKDEQEWAQKWILENPNITPPPPTIPVRTTANDHRQILLSKRKRNLVHWIEPTPDNIEILTKKQRQLLDKFNKLEHKTNLLEEMIYNYDMIQDEITIPFIEKNGTQEDNKLFDTYWDKILELDEKLKNHKSL